MKTHSLRSLSIALLAVLQLVLAPLGSMAHCSAAAEGRDCCCAHTAPEPQPKSCCSSAHATGTRGGDLPGAKSAPTGQDRREPCGCTMDGAPTPPVAEVQVSTIALGHHLAPAPGAASWFATPGASVGRLLRLRPPGVDPPRYLAFRVLRL
ncbi:hypothetical protein [Engelhardtia mirabilis]|uniref:Uncharacterized protein n=1 Tax=Engelhardtia mirabilis TaxID=2528011 RepID=A0A518BQB2_9BACT|nr:hypothetical protein Pla133_42750 [Planctomycetes bacterium Pla133]QDV03486.1 hypothetical protein Pla86_42740 [Planctomycetes bacterium Pla86]